MRVRMVVPPLGPSSRALGPQTVIPAKAGISPFAGKSEIPAFAGMTINGECAGLTTWGHGFCVSFGLSWSSSADAPATVGAAIEVPDRYIIFMFEVVETPDSRCV